MVEDIKALFKVLFLFLPLPVFWTLFDQQVRGHHEPQALTEKKRIVQLLIKDGAY